MADGKQLNMRNPAVKRILQEVKEMQRETSTEFMSMPLEEDIFEWQFAIHGPKDTEFEGGIYHGRITLPADYPFKPPSFMLLTPSGRFEVQTKICLSISNHHPEHWQPSWSVRTALVALIAFLPTKPDGALGSLDFTKAERRKLAAQSRLAPPRFGSAARQNIIQQLHEAMLATVPPLPVLTEQQVRQEEEEDREKRRGIKGKEKIGEGDGGAAPQAAPQPNNAAGTAAEASTAGPGALNPNPGNLGVGQPRGGAGGDTRPAEGSGGASPAGAHAGDSMTHAGLAEAGPSTFSPSRDSGLAGVGTAAAAASTHAGPVAAAAAAQSAAAPAHAPAAAGGSAVAGALAAGGGQWPGTCGGAAGSGRSWPVGGAVAAASAGGASHAALGTTAAPPGSTAGGTSSMPLPAVSSSGVRVGGSSSASGREEGRAAREGTGLGRGGGGGPQAGHHLPRQQRQGGQRGQSAGAAVQLLGAIVEGALTVAIAAVCAAIVALLVWQWMARGLPGGDVFEEGEL